MSREKDVFEDNFLDNYLQTELLFGRSIFVGVETHTLVSLTSTTISFNLVINPMQPPLAVRSALWESINALPASPCACRVKVAFHHSNKVCRLIRN